MKFAFSRKVNNSLQEVGCWVSLDDSKFDGQLILTDPGTGPAVRIASAESRLYKDAYDKGVRQYQRVIQSERFIPWYIREKIENIALQAAITAWVGVEDEQSQPVEFSKETILAALEHEPDFRKRCTEVANDLALYKQQGEEEDIANLKRTSSTSLNGAVAAEPEQAGTTPLH